MKHFFTLYRLLYRSINFKENFSLFINLVVCKFVFLICGTKKKPVSGHQKNFCCPETCFFWFHKLYFSLNSTVFCSTNCTFIEQHEKSQNKYTKIQLNNTILSTTSGVNPKFKQNQNEFCFPFYAFCRCAAYSFIVASFFL